MHNSIQLLAVLRCLLEQPPSNTTIVLIGWLLINNIGPRATSFVFLSHIVALLQS
jgi:hypothetical protein